MEDQKIVDLFWERDCDAITHSEEKYGTYCYRIAHNILSIPQDAEECVNDTWVQAWESIPPQRPVFLRAFLGKITRNLSINRWYALQAEKRGSGEVPLVLEELSQCVGRGDSPEACYTAKELSKCISDFLRQLPQREANIFLRRYYNTEPLKTLGKDWGLSENHTAVLLSRTRKKLKDHLIREGFIYD